MKNLSCVVRLARIALATLLLFAGPAVCGAAAIVQDGKLNAQIIISEHAPRTTRLAAWELRKYVHKMSGAVLPIVNAPTDDAPVKIYIGQSEYTDKLEISNEDLKYGAYRIVSGDNWLVLIGQDSNFEPTEPYTRVRSQRGSEATLARWDEIAGGHQWAHPEAIAFKYRFRNVQQQYPNARSASPMTIWSYDERGSFNAVCGFLRELGVRWYMPGELGEVVPHRDSIALPEIDRRVEPAFEVRDSSVRVGVHDPRSSFWAMRLGMRQPYGVVGAHGLNAVTGREVVRRTHPEYFVLAGGKRHSKKQCLSNAGLLASTIAYARTVVDHYGYKVVNLMPADGYTALCKCQRCAGRDSPDRPYRGRLSNYVWGFVSRVAEALARTHPDAQVSNVAYNVYLLPPDDVEKLPDNVLVGLKGARQPVKIDSRLREEMRTLRQSWLAMTEQKLLNHESFTARGYWLPAFTPHVNARSINALKGDFLGERFWLSTRFLGRMEDSALHSLLGYVNFRMYWGDKDQSIEPILEEFYTRFYGPAASQMRTFYDYCEAHFPQMRDEKAKIDRALALFAAARDRVEADSVYGKRLALLDEYLNKLRGRGEQIVREQKREHGSELRMWKHAKGINIDGRLDDAYWQRVPNSGGLRELRTGRKPVFGTSFQVAWGGNAIYFAIRCRDLPGHAVQVGAERDEDPAIWQGEVVEIHLETQQNAYYQIAISPTGAVVDLNRAGRRKSFRWDSQAEVATHIEDGSWTIEARIPVTEATDDPLHQVIGERPSKRLPWYFNICRKRLGAHGRELSAFSPTGETNFHVPSRFAKLYYK